MLGESVKRGESSLYKKRSQLMKYSVAYLTWSEIGGTNLSIRRNLYDNSEDGSWKMTCLRRGNFHPGSLEVPWPMLTSVIKQRRIVSATTITTTTGISIDEYFDSRNSTNKRNHNDGTYSKRREFRLRPCQRPRWLTLRARARRQSQLLRRSNTEAHYDAPQEGTTSAWGCSPSTGWLEDLFSFGSLKAGIYSAD
jgi:hypothetical protein